MKLFQCFLFLSLGVHQVFANYGGHDLFTSLAQLHTLWKNEQVFVQKMETAITNMESLTQSMKRYVKSYKDLQLDKEPNFDFLGHPLNSYFLVRHVALAYEHLFFKILGLKNDTIEFIETIHNRSEVEMLPSHRDVEGASFGVARLHSLYSLETDALVDEGVVKTTFNNKDIHSEPSVQRLNSWDLTMLGSQANQHGLYNTMVDAYRKAIERTKDEASTNSFEGDIFEQDQVNQTFVESLNRKAVQMHDQILDRRGSRSHGYRTHEYPIDPKLKKKKKFSKKKIREAEANYVPIRKALPRTRDTPSDLEEEYAFKPVFQKEQLCSGITFRTPNETKNLYCFNGHNGSPWLRLGPIKVEIQNFDPYIAVFRKLMFEHECDEVIKFLAPRLDFPPGRMSGGRMAKNDWTMKNTWPDENDNKVLEKMTRRVEHIMDILAASNKGQSDNFMCGNYGVGGHYGTHPDFYDYDEAKFLDPTSLINRISTVMTVLDSPEAGGATVWPFVGVYVMPEKGSAVAWYNTRSDAQVDLDTQHAACPVLLGQKWIGNKWIAYKAQWQKKLCTEPFARIMGPLK